MLKAIVITPNDKTVDFGCLLAIARAEACKREQSKVNPLVRALVFVAELGVYMAVYGLLIERKAVNENSFVEKTGNRQVECEKSRVEAS